MAGKRKPVPVFTLLIGTVCIIILAGFLGSFLFGKVVPHKDRWGIYALDFSTEKSELTYSFSERIEYL